MKSYVELNGKRFIISTVDIEEGSRKNLRLMGHHEVADTIISDWETAVAPVDETGRHLESYSLLQSHGHDKDAAERFHARVVDNPGKFLKA